MKYPWMPLFWGDFLANTMHLSAQEAGAYLFLIAHAWEQGGEIPGERVRLARIAHVRPDQWPRVWKVLEQFFVPMHAVTTPNGPLLQWYIHRRVTDELQRLGKISSKRKAAAEQKHSKSYANEPANAPASTSTSNRDYSLNGKKDADAFAAETEHRPSKKSDNDLNDPTREDLKLLMAKR
jgi:uncharacterized protein YdaU (DUF1376 family)